MMRLRHTTAVTVVWGMGYYYCYCYCQGPKGRMHEMGGHRVVHRHHTITRVRLRRRMMMMMGEL
jgi:hypothetical protein